MVNNTSRLVDRYSNHLISSCPKDVAKVVESTTPMPNFAQQNTLEHDQSGGSKMNSSRGSRKKSGNGKKNVDKLSQNLFGTSVKQLTSCKKRIDNAL